MEFQKIAQTEKYNSIGEKPEIKNADGVSLLLMSESGFLNSLWLPIKAEGRHAFWSSAERKSIDFLFLEAVNGSWQAICKKDAYFQDTENRIFYNTCLNHKCIFYIICKKMKYLLYVEYTNHYSKVFHNYFVTGDTSLTIGRKEENDICYPNNYVSRRHALLQYTNNTWMLTDLGSGNGVFINDVRIETHIQKRLCVGDRIQIMGLQILIGTNFLSMNDGNDRIKTNSWKLFAFVDSENRNMTVCRKKKELVFNRLPLQRVKRNIKPIKIEAPPLSLQSNQIPMILRMGSSMVMGGSAMMSGHYASVLSMLLFPLLTNRYTDKQKKEYEEMRKKKYQAYLEQKRQEIEDEKIAEEIYLNEVYPSINQLFDLSGNKEKLWSRKKTDDDFLHIRIGCGKKAMLAEIQYPGQRFTLDEDELEKEMYYLAEKDVFIEDVPILLKMPEDYVCSIVGEESLKKQLFLYILMQIVFWHSYDEVKLIFLLDEALLKEFDLIRYLPHVWDEERSFRFIATDSSEGYLIGDYLNRKIEDDLKKSKDLNMILKTRPYYVVFAWNKKVSDVLEILHTIQHEDKNSGISILTFFEEMPQTTHELIMLQREQFHKIIYLKNPDNGTQNFQFDIVNQERVNTLFKKISNITLKGYERAFVLPQTLSFLEMFGAGKVEHLNPTKRWRENNPSKSLAVPVGVSTDGSLFLLDLHEKYQGPHGLVAGMTGSGKSEFLITYILSLAVNFHPNEVAFVLIDYKGGGLVGAFANGENGIYLPHLAGTITNLDGAAIHRSLMSIESELKRRQKLFNEAKSATNEGTMDIYTYQTLYRSGKVKEPLPHLFIISDEFAELKSQEPEFMNQLISAARIGRSLGIHLILATQKPAGVVNDQINSNSKFRVCFKVQTRADSDEMLRRSEAAEIKETGRFYLQVGYNEFFALGQSAWCGSPYEPQEEMKEVKDDVVQFLDHTGQTMFQVKKKKKKTESKHSQLVAIVKYLTSVAEMETIPKR